MSVRQNIHTSDYLCQAFRKWSQVFYDVRNDADALYNLYGVNLKNVYDLQLLELAVRHSLRRPTKFLNGLSKSITSYLTPPMEWEPVKQAGLRLFQPEFGGSYSVFEERPLDPRIVAYCAQDVTLLFELEGTLRGSFGRFGSNWENRIVAGSARRVSLAEGAYERNGRHRALAPAL
jgi:exonuclease 3'-5' domain-containing protein 1